MADRTQALARSLRRDAFLSARAGLMPWTDQATLLDRCTGCGDCAPVCPEGIVRLDRGGHPAIRFDRACTFCGACARACAEGVFDPERDPPWTARAVVRPACLETRGIACRACEDLCPETAISARPQPGGVTRIEVDDDTCTGCGACVAACPAAAIEVVRHG